MRKLLFATDGSPASDKAAKTAMELLEAWQDATLMVVHVLPLAMMPADSVIPDNIMEAEAASAKEIMLRTKEQFKPWEGRVSFKTFVGYPAKVIMDAAEQIHADLIIVGSHGRGFVNRLFLGSVSDVVAQRAKSPVLVVH